MQRLVRNECGVGVGGAGMYVSGVGAGGCWVGVAVWMSNKDFYQLLFHDTCYFKKSVLYR